MLSDLLDVFGKITSEHLQLEVRDDVEIIGDERILVGEFAFFGQPNRDIFGLNDFRFFRFL